MTLTLRGHHLLCTLNSGGSGDTPAFMRNLDNVVARVGCPWFGHCGRTARAGWPKSRLFKRVRGARP